MSRKLDSRAEHNACLGDPHPSYTKFPPDNPTPDGDSGTLQGSLEGGLTALPGHGQNPANYYTATSLCRGLRQNHIAALGHRGIGYDRYP